MAEELEEVGAGFQIPGRFVAGERVGSGHIHDTFAVTYRDGSTSSRYVHQRLNQHVFPDLDALMGNLVRVTRHQWEALCAARAREPERRCLRLVPTHEGRAMHRDSKGAAWRTFHFLEGARSHDTVSGAAQAHQIARAFGAFAAALSDLPSPPLAETIPGFHDLRARFAALEEAVASDAHQRLSRVRNEADRAAAFFHEMEQRLEAGGYRALPWRNVHNDCKINNVMLDDASGEGICVIDLDTVMGGTLLCDFGELVRTAISRSPEDEPDLASVRLDLELFRAVARGYLAGSAPILRSDELALLPLAGPVMALENGIRFLTDHLRGDVYFRIHRAGHNLDRARVQLRLVELMLARLDALRGIVEEAWRETRQAAQPLPKQ